MVNRALLSQVTSLPPAERMELIGAVWESLDLTELPVTEGEKALLDTRIEDEIKNPGDVSPWPEVKARLSQRLR